MVVAQWVRHWSSGHKVVQAEGFSLGRGTYHIFFSSDFISVLLHGIMDFSDIVILCSRLNSCCQHNLRCFDMPLLSLDLFS